MAFALGLVLWASFCRTALAQRPMDQDPVAEGERVVRELRKAEDVRFAAELEGLALRCDQLQAVELAMRTRAWRIPRDPQRTYLFLPAESVQGEAEKPLAAAGDGDAARLEAFWLRRFLQMRRTHSERLVELARTALEQNEGELAYQWLHEALREDPDNQIARQALGYRVVQERWRLPQGKPRVSVVRAPNRKLGFSPSRHWRVESEHFRLLTDHSAESGAKAVQELEATYALWRQVFFDYWSDAKSLQRQLDSPAAPRRGGRKFSVVLFANRQKYEAVLGADQPLLAKTVGIYLDGQRTAFFYVGEDETRTTRIHEATHQFFSETPGASDSIGRRANFWVVEAIALYMESLQQHDGFYTVGGLDANRVQYARYRAYNEQFYAPLAALTDMSRDTLQQHEEIRRLYSQSAGLAAYFLNGTTPERRHRFLAFVREVYRGDDQPDSLAKQLKAELPEVDRDYLLSLMVDDRIIERWPQGHRQNLSLGHTHITDRGLAALGQQPRLKWLDLAATKITDASGPVLSGYSALEQLNLEGTQVSDAALPQLAKLSSLVELDLSSTKITGAGLRALAPLSQLKILWLTDTAVDDEAIQALSPLKSLERLHVGGASVTAEGLRRLRKALPQLKE